jgi:hypothetical protein
MFSSQQSLRRSLQVRALAFWCRWAHMPRSLPLIFHWRPYSPVHGRLKIASQLSTYLVKLGKIFPPLSVIQLRVALNVMVEMHNNYSPLPQCLAHDGYKKLGTAFDGVNRHWFSSDANWPRRRLPTTLLSHLLRYAQPPSVFSESAMHLARPSRRGHFIRFGRTMLRMPTSRR